MHDLLNDPIIGVKTPSGERRVDLPGVISGLLAGDVVSYTGLRDHQSDPWHVFLVQIAASVMARHPELDEPPRETDFWRSGLLDLADGQATAWELVVDDVTLPAFLQHPLSGPEEIVSFKPKEPKARTPDELDVLVTAKDHDVKKARIRPDDAEAWLFAMLTYQTTSGFLGAGNYGSIRMNGGFGSRCVVSLVSDLAPAARFREELRVVTDDRRRVLEQRIGYLDRGIVLTWIQRWNRDGHCHLITSVESLFIEASRPLRLVFGGHKICALGSTSKARLMGPKAIENGDIGDPWIPINVGDKKKGRSALTVGGSGWTAQRIVDILLRQDLEPTPLQVPRGVSDKECWLNGSVLVRGQGTTEGFHRFAIPVPARSRLRLLSFEGRESVGQASKALLQDAADIESALRYALRSHIEDEPAGAKGGRQDSTGSNWSKAITRDFNTRWSDDFFPFLWQFADGQRDEVRQEWRSSIVNLARSTLQEAEQRMPRRTGRRYHSLVQAQDRFTGVLRQKGLIPTAAQRSWRTDDE